jgi:hypothetical protein
MHEWIDLPVAQPIASAALIGIAIAPRVGVTLAKALILLFALGRYLICCPCAELAPLDPRSRRASRAN